LKHRVHCSIARILAFLAFLKYFHYLVDKRVLPPSGPAGNGAGVRLVGLARAPAFAAAASAVAKRLWRDKSARQGRLGRILVRRGGCGAAGLRSTVRRPGKEGRETRLAEKWAVAYFSAFPCFGPRGC
jgi:hypothetical protein